MRRRHGIPDSDHRPFNVAYAAASKARSEREASEKSRSRLGSAAPAASSAVNGQAAARQRHGITGVFYAPKFDGHFIANTHGLVTESQPERPISMVPIPGALHFTPAPQQTSPLDPVGVPGSHT